MDEPQFKKSAAACLDNGKRLLRDAEMLEYENPPNTCYALAIIAQEEFAKAFLLLLVSRGVIPWHPVIHRATRDHACKQLLGFVMSYINPECDFARDMEWLKENEERKALLASYTASTGETEKTAIWKRIAEIRERWDSLPQSVVDAVSILRYENVGRFEPGTRVWAEKPVYDKAAKSLGKGRLDRERQDSLYVRIGRSGHVAGASAQVEREEAKAAMETAGRMRDLIKGCPASGTQVFNWEHKMIEEVIKAKFANLAERGKRRSAVKK
ncbi:MAG: AbiV family abortive infection protein [Candidatus Acidiferrales bacterium]